MVILSNGEVSGRFPDIGQVAALIVATGAPTMEPEGLAAGALLVPAMAISGKDLRRELGPLIRKKVWTVRSFPGEAVRLEFVRGGLRAPPDATAVEPSSPSGNASTSSRASPATPNRRRDSLQIAMVNAEATPYATTG